MLPPEIEEICGQVFGVFGELNKSDIERSPQDIEDEVKRRTSWKGKVHYSQLQLPEEE